MDDNPNEILVHILDRTTDHTTDPNRPFTGQPQTEQGERGKTEIKNIRMRDLAEMRARAEDGTLNYNDPPHSQPEPNSQYHENTSPPSTTT